MASSESPNHNPSQQHGRSSTPIGPAPECGEPTSSHSRTNSIPIWNLGESQQLPATKIGTGTLRRGGLVLHLRASTWAADSHGLFDYESKNVYAKIFKCNCIRDIYHIVRVGTDVQLLGEDQAKALYATEPRTKFLAQLLWVNGSYNLVPNCATATAAATSPPHQNERLWLVVRTLKERGVAVTQGDLIKLGRYRVKVKEIVASSQDVKSMDSGRFLCHDEDDEDDCETVAPDPIEISVAAVDVANGFNPSDEVIDANVSAPVSDSSPQHLSPQASPNLSTPSSVSEIQQLNAVPEPPSEPSSLLQAKCSLGPRICRICLCEAEDDDIDDVVNPLVAPCECKGSMKWVHLMCLRTWMAGRLNIRNDGSMVCFFWRALECELCKVLYPSVVKIVDPNCVTSDDEPNSSEPQDSTARYRRMSDSKANYGKPSSLVSNSGAPLKKSKSAQGWRTVELFEIPRPEVPYIILEPRSQQGRGLHVVSLANNKTARLGRGHESDIRLADISVSRLHAILRFQTSTARRVVSSPGLAGSGGLNAVNPYPHGCFVIEDNRSKFGTLLEIRKPFRLDPQAVPISIQVGRTVLTFTLKRRWRFMFPACLRHPTGDVSVILQQYPQNMHPPQIHSASTHRAVEHASEDPTPFEENPPIALADPDEGHQGNESHPDNTYQGSSMPNPLGMQDSAVPLHNLPSESEANSNEMAQIGHSL